MNSWEQYPYLFNLELLHDYIPNDTVTLFIKDAPDSYKKRFKDWRGIVSSVKSHLKYGNISAIICYADKKIIMDIFEDANPTVQCYPFEEYMNWRKLTNHQNKLEV